MASKLVTTERLSRFLYNIRQIFLTGVSYDSTNNKIVYTKNGSNTDVVTAATLKSAMSLGSVADGAEVNQNAFSNVKVGSTTVAADAKTDTLELVAGSNITLTPDDTNDKITIAATDNQRTPATATPNMDGTGAVGSSDKYAREDHVHPSDTTRVPTSRKVAGKALSADISLDASDVGAIPTSAKGAASGVCPLNASSKIDSTYLPSYVDDVVEAYPRSGQTELSSAWLATGSASGSAITPETGKLYILMSDSTNYSANSQFRWSGTTYVEIISGGYTLATDSDIDAIFS